MAPPDDARLFGPAARQALGEALRDFSWLLSRGYSDRAALALVGDRYQLHARQRRGVLRCAATAAQCEARARQRQPLAGARVMVDGFNQLVTMEVALAGGLVLRGRDGLLRDLASMHGRYRRSARTEQALAALAAALAPCAEVRWVLDRPVSHSGALAGLIRGLGFEVELSDEADRVLIESGRPVASGDGPVIDRAGQHVDLLGGLIGPDLVVDFTA